MIVLCAVPGVAAKLSAAKIRLFFLLIFVDFGLVHTCTERTAGKDFSPFKNAC